MTHWAETHIGRPWVSGLSDCWCFARGIWRERWGWDVPALTVDPQNARATRRALAIAPETIGWHPVTVAREGDAVLMARGARPCHIGIWITPAPQPGILHSVERAGVIFTTESRLAVMGYRIVGLYRRRS